MPQLILLRGARQLLTLRGSSGARRGAALHDLGIIEDGSVLIRDGIIAAVGPTRRIENLKEARGALEIPVHGRVVMPGFVDAGLTLSLTRKRKTLAGFHDESLTLLRSCLQHGTLTTEVKTSIDPGDLRSAIPVLRQLTKIGSNPVGMVRTWRISRMPPSTENSSSEFLKTLAALGRRKLAQFVEVGLESEQAWNEPLLEAIEETGLAMGMGLKLLWRSGSPEAMAKFLDRFNPRTVSCPAYLSSDECSLLSNSSSMAVFAPGRVAFDGPTADSARQVADLGGALALATEYDSSYAASSSMQMALSWAIMRLHLTPEEAIVAATINAAHALGLGHFTGSLEFKKQADVLVLNVNDYRVIPRQFGINHVEMAIRDGTIVFSRAPWKVSAHGQHL